MSREMQMKSTAILFFIAWLLVGCNSGGNSSSATQTAGGSYPPPAHNVSTAAPLSYPVP
jgi:hypothetical protein